MNNTILKYTVTEENRNALCDEIASAVETFCKALKYSSKETIRYRITIEECILNWMETNPIGEEITFSCGKRLFFIPFLELDFTGSQLNPFFLADESHAIFEKSVLNTLGLSPSYHFENEKNVLRFDLKRPSNPFVNLLIVIAVATLVGFVGKMLIPHDARNAILTNFIGPINNTFFRILNSIAGPMIFLSVAWGIYGIGDMATFSKIGKKMMASFIFTVFLATIIASFIFNFMGLSISQSASSDSQFKAIFEMVLDFFPPNIVDPFAKGNTIQIIVFAFAMGIALLFLGKKTEFVAQNIEQINYLVQFLMGLISKIVPFFVFIVVVNLFWSDSMDIIPTASKIIFALIGFIIILCGGYYLFTGFRMKMNPMLLIKKCLPVLVVALSTASSSATFSTQVDVCNKKLGINKSVSSFGIPLAMVLQKPFTAISYLLLSFFFASYYSIPCSTSWIVTAIFVCAVMAVATPPIPGGTVAAYAVIFLQLGIPQDALVITLALDIVIDVLTTGANMFALPVALTNIASHVGMLDRNVIKSK